ncbi:phosphoglucosamine mutase-like protein [Perilla frutescens var. frutescens]|nr:phosphoglucosamine mutase-like protein [Perilla frutescens var. frutescens]
MITASHNEVSDNGVKLADPSGGMLTQSWEPFADSLANAPDPHSLLQLLDDFVKKENIILEASPAAEVLLGRDTRPSRETLLEAAKQGITSIMGATASDMGILTTPQLHWMVLVGYVPQGNSSKNVSNKLIVDGADGVGGEKLEKMKTRLGYLTIDVRNCGDGVLNEGVGADFVQKEKVVPRSFGPADAGMRCASLDGDADRLVYFFVLSNSNKIDLVDGDKILSLFAVFLKEQLGILNGPEDGKANKSYQPSLGVVQTAYANGASTDYLKQLGLEFTLTPTGVKYLHEKAAELKTGTFFEIKRLNSDQHKAALRLLAISRLINQAVGDALSGLFLVEVILKHMGWSIHKWNELYQDLPSRQLKVKVVDRTAVITENVETKVVSPAGIQEAIDAETVIYPKGRCFIRPSGTEDVVRVYAEASTQEAADSLANSVVRLVEQYLGIGHS